MTQGGISRRIVNFAQSLVGGVRGGLFYVMIIACGFFAALSGSAPATVIAIGAMLYPDMIKRGYPQKKSRRSSSCSWWFRSYHSSINYYGGLWNYYIKLNW